MGREDSTLTIAFESSRLSYSNQEVDLYNSGINQILSVAAVRGHLLYHFSMEDLYVHEDVPYARASVLSLPDSWYSDPLEAHVLLKKIDERPLPLRDVDLCFFRADDVRNADTPNLDILRTVEEHGTLIENIDVTLSTCDKYEIARRVPDVPQPVTFAASSLDEAMEAISKLPNRGGYFVLKDRFGYGCGHGVHRIEFADPELLEVVNMYLEAYDKIILGEYCPEIAEGDIVVTFFDGELVAPMRREASFGEWKTNYSLGATQNPHMLSPEHEEIARTVQRAFSDCRFMSVDMLLSGKVMEVNAFPGGRGLLDLYGISVGNMIIDRLEDELLGLARAPASIARSLVSESTSRWDDIDALYEGFEESVETLDVFSYDGYTLSTKELVEFRPGNLDFILSIPHAGVLVPTDFAEHFELDTSSLVEIDLFSDVIFEALGGAQVISRLAPFFVDMNREREGSKGKQIPKHLKNPATEYYTVQDEPILQEPYSASEEEKVIKYYDLYHEMLSTLIERMKRERGYALIIDGHSMMSTGLGRVHDTGQERDNFVLGTLGGTSACEGIVSAFGSSLKQGTESHGLSLTFAKDDPYSGGFITRKHHDPKNNVHVIQVEVTMGTYMYEPVDEDVVRRYALKQPRVTIVQDILRNAVRSACEMAERVYLR